MLSNSTLQFLAVALIHFCLLYLPIACFKFVFDIGIRHELLTYKAQEELILGLFSAFFCFFLFDIFASSCVHCIAFCDWLYNEMTFVNFGCK